MIWVEAAKGWDKAMIKANDEVAAEVDWQCLAGSKRPGSILEALEVLVMVATMSWLSGPGANWRMCSMTA